MQLNFFVVRAVRRIILDQSVSKIIVIQSFRVGISKKNDHGVTKLVM